MLPLAAVTLSLVVVAVAAIAVVALVWITGLGAELQRVGNEDADQADPSREGPEVHTTSGDPS